jgi:hypothetical protein
MPPQKPLSKEEIENTLGYSLPLRITEEEKELIRHTFKGNDELFKLLKKMFLPSATNPETPIEYVDTDLMMDINWADVPNEQVKSIVLAKQYAIRMVRGAIMQLKVFANEKIETYEELQTKAKKNSSK